jgi:hypothetical protein
LCHPVSLLLKYRKVLITSVEKEFCAVKPHLLGKTGLRPCADSDRKIHESHDYGLFLIFDSGSKRRNHRLLVRALNRVSSAMEP